MQMLAGGAILILMGTLSGEWAMLDLQAISFNSWLALGYLIVFGAIVAFTAYSWLLKNATPAAISTYAYVNPAIAVLLGWAVANETFTASARRCGDNCRICCAYKFSEKELETP